ncbi:MAG: c-type cytochrome [Candidatus Marinimicrobia bacterium]|nr:c-type cytochrome [Candidatus Neomarinimicrobiota bacterium]
MRRIFVFPLLCFSLLFFWVAASLAEGIPSAELLIRELSCSGCHTDLKTESFIREKIPDLSFAGLKYNSAYLLEYLQNPEKVRHNIGYSRMPDFHLSEKEAFALALFLETQNTYSNEYPNFPSWLHSESHPDYSTPINIKEELFEAFECVKCHSPGVKGKERGSDLSTVGYRLKKNWVKMYFVSPALFDGADTPMPSFFYDISDDGRQYSEALSQAPELINRVTDQLYKKNTRRKAELEEKYNNAKKSYPDVIVADGEKIFTALNCATCHRHSSTEPWKDSMAPKLSFEGSRVLQNWLQDYLSNPYALRPFGYLPGSGSRMPDYHLTPEEVTVLTEYLIKNEKKLIESELFRPAKLSPFAMKKARGLLDAKLPCLGCHRIGADGGRIGPDLSNVKSRLKPSFVFDLIKNPHAADPNIIMPKTVMPVQTLELISSYLLQLNGSKVESKYLSLVDNPVLTPNRMKGDNSLYLKQCSSCHGIDGDGKGFNAKYLPTAPRSHKDSEYLSKRPDDVLFDGIFAGGYILDKSNFMPAFGHTLSRSEIENLVSHIRKLCQCEGPAWSLDNQSGYINE